MPAETVFPEEGFHRLMRVTQKVFALIKMVPVHSLIQPSMLPISQELFRLAFEETSLSSSICQRNTTCLGGFARLFEAIEALRREKPDALLLNAGDSFQGTYWYTLLKWNVTQHFMNMLPHDAHAIGNHEFDDGVPGLVPYMKALKAPIVAANLNTTLEPRLKGLYKPYVNSSSPGKVRFEDPKTAAQREAKHLTDQGVNIIILLSHVGLKIDNCNMNELSQGYVFSREIASDFGENIDVIVGGHSHSLLWNGTSPSGEDVSGPYPIVVESRTRPDHKVLVVTASAFTKYLGDISVWFNAAGESDTFKANPLYLNHSIPENEKMKKLLAPYTKDLHSKVSIVIGEAKDDLELKECSMRECALGNLISDGLLQTTKDAKVSNLTHVSFVVRNAIRNNILKGTITRGDVINAVPFSSKVQTFALKGEYLRQTFEYCVTSAWTQTPFNGPSLPQVAGLKVTFNTSREIGDRVVSILTKNGEQYEPLEMDRDYQVTTYSFIATGRDGFGMLKGYLKDLVTLKLDAESLEDIIRKYSPITPRLEGRLVMLY
ncbi:Apyrase [Eumeta japonica]|uniref:apyrase n=1 Tax=Eumeta variegata TaxID=151549 RepID=A0A4C1UZS9_EUMVA|nr:Apyrase [Eumeta japonica]